MWVTCEPTHIFIRTCVSGMNLVLWWVSQGMAENIGKYSVIDKSLIDVTLSMYVIIIISCSRFGVDYVRLVSCSILVGNKD